MSVPLDYSPVLWLRASDLSGSDSSQITTWVDQSGNGNDATGVASSSAKPLLRTAAGPTGGKAVQFQNDGYFTLTNIMSGATAGEIFLVVKSDGFNCGSWAFGSDAGNGDEGHYPFGGLIYEQFGKASGDRKDSISPSVSISSAFRKYNVWSANNDWQANLDGASQATDASNTVTWTSNPRIGMGRKGGANELPFQGHIVEVLLFTRKLSSTERTNVNNYLDATYFGSATVTPSTVAATTAVGAPTLQAGSVVTPSTVAAVAAVGTPFVAVGDSAFTTPSTVAATAAVGSPTIHLSTQATPATVARTAAVGAPSIHTSVLITPATVARTAAVGTAFTTPTNDSWQDAVVLAGTSGSQSGTLVHATADRDFAYTSPYGDAADTVWYRVTISGTDLHFNATITGASTSLLLEIFGADGSTEEPLGPPLAVAVGTTTTVGVDVTDSGIYYIRVSPETAGDEITFTLDWELVARDTSGGGSSGSTGDLQLTWKRDTAQLDAGQILDTPGMMTLDIGDGDPSGTADIYVDGDLVGTVILDADGNAFGVSVMVPALTAGTHTVTVTSAALTSDIDFTVLQDSTDSTPDDTDTTPTPSGVTRWLLRDPLGDMDDLEFTFNPSSSGNPYPERPFDGAATTSPTGTYLEWEGEAGPFDWVVEGFGDTPEFYTALVAWTLLNRRVWLYDHRGWVYEVTVENFAPEQRNDKNEMENFNYKLTFRIFNGPSVVA